MNLLIRNILAAVSADHVDPPVSTFLFYYLVDADRAVVVARGKHLARVKAGRCERDVQNARKHRTNGAGRDIAVAEFKAFIDDAAGLAADHLFFFLEVMRGANLIGEHTDDLLGAPEALRVCFHSGNARRLVGGLYDDLGRL